jgi:phospholipid/cholesterol/gamma-HCH transport system substrate-binding protein
MLQSRAVEIWVGFFVAIGLVALFFLAMQVSNLSDLNMEDGYRIIARFENSGSLKERSPISIAGVRIGRVSKIWFDEDRFQAVVEMNIDPQYNKLPVDTSASILTAGLLGEQYVGLKSGGSEEFLKDGDEIELTQSAIVLEEVIGRFLFSKAEGGNNGKKNEE